MEWAGASGRDRAIRSYVSSLVVPPAEELSAQAPVTMLLGPRGSGKTSLLAHMAEWARNVPVARLDMRGEDSGLRRSVDVLAEVAFGLNTPKQHFKNRRRISFPTFGLLAAALTAEIDSRDRAEALRQVDEALTGAPGRRAETMGQLVQDVASVTGLPSAVTAVLRLLPYGQRAWLHGRGLLRLRRVKGESGIASAREFCLHLNRTYKSLDAQDRVRAERVLFEAFLGDLRRAYGRRTSTTRCLVLLDNADSDLGGAVLRSLMEARHRVEAADPLVVVAMAGSYPLELEDAEFGWQYGGDALPGGWPDDGLLDPQEVAPGFRVAKLRDLNRQEVELQVGKTMAATRAPAPRSETGSRWLGWVVHEITRGHPAATARLRAELREFGERVEWDERLRRVFAPPSDLVDALLQRILPHGTQEELRPLLATAAAAPDLAQALVTQEFQDEANASLREPFDAFATDPLRTLHLHSGDEGVDGRTETPHPLLRRLLLHTLPGPDAVHAGLSAEAAARGDQQLSVYHALAAGDLASAAAYLDSLFEDGPPQEWCGLLCRLRRAPLRPADPGDDPSPWRRYETLVRDLGSGQVPDRLRTVTRLLAASWIGPEPPADPATDRVGDPYRDPLADPFAELFAEIRSRFHTLAERHTRRVEWTSMLRAKARQYEKEPWR